MKTNLKLNLLTALALAVLPTLALADNTAVEHVGTLTPRPQVATANTLRPMTTPVAFKNALQFNEVDGQPIR